MDPVILQVTNVSKQFADDDALFHDLSFSIKKGEFVAIIGPNGSGKTTLIHILLGLIEPTTGKVDLSESNIGFVPQQSSKDLYSPLSVRELFLCKLKDARFWTFRKQADKRIQEALRLTAVEHLLNRQLKHLSGGEFQRVMIAFALLNNPQLLILDEPISGIDIHGEQNFFDLIEQIHKQLNITIVLISHDIDVVYRYATQVICLNKQIVCQGVPRTVLTKEAIEKTFSTKHGLYHHQHDAIADHEH